MGVVFCWEGSFGTRTNCCNALQYRREMNVRRLRHTAKRGREMAKLRESPLYGRGELPIDFTPMTWENVIVGEEMGPVDYDIKVSSHLKHADIIQVHHPWFQEELHLFAPWEMMCGARVMSRWKYGRLNAGLMTALDFHFFKPAKAGQKLLGEVIVVDKYHKRGRDYVLHSTTTKDENGEKLFWTREELILLGEHKGQVAGHSGEESRKERWQEKWEQDGEEAEASPDLPLGFVLKCQIRKPLAMAVSGSAAGGWSKDKWVDNIHSDDYAKSKGYAGGVVEAYMVWEFGLLEMLVNFFGPEKLFTTGMATTKICGPGYVGDTVVGKAKVIDKIPELSGTRLVLATRVERENGEMLNVGTISAIT